MERDTIAAISTAQLPSGIAVIRLSGHASFDIVQKIFSGKKPLREAYSHSMVYGNIQDGDKIIDDVLVSVMYGPNTYTGEDVAEINCHGSLLIQKKILSLLLENGARMADPGEYTMRAFLNGRLDLDQAESVMDIISSENEYFLSKSREHLSGDFSALINDTRNKILYEIAYIESALDDPEHISLDGYDERLSDVLDDVESVITRLIDTYGHISSVRNGIDCAIIGRTNVGKSSLLNALSRSEKAIVTDIPGTTRDAIEQKINIGTLSLNIIDTAGIRESDDEIENIGIDISKRRFEDSQLVLLVLDGSSPLNETDRELLRAADEKNAFVLINKCDLFLNIDLTEIKKLTNKKIIKISAKNFIGINEIADSISNMFLSESAKYSSEPVLTNERQLQNLLKAYESIKKVRIAMDEGMTEEIFTVDMTDAYDSLGRIIGLNVGDDVINEIFSKFCIGK